MTTMPTPPAGHFWSVDAALGDYEVDLRVRLRRPMSWGPFHWNWTVYTIWGKWSPSPEENAETARYLGLSILDEVAAGRHDLGDLEVNH